MSARFAHFWGLQRPYKAIHALAYARFQDIAKRSAYPTLSRRQRIKSALNHIRWDWAEVDWPVDANDWHMFNGLRWEPAYSLLRVWRFHPPDFGGEE